MSFLKELLSFLEDMFGMLFGMIMFAIGVVVLIYALVFGPLWLLAPCMALIGLGAFIAARNA